MSDVYIGIDVHQRQSFYCVLSVHGGVIEHKQISTDREAFEVLVGQYISKGGVKVAIETGGSTWWVSQVLMGCGADVYPVNARELKLIAHSKRKTDKYDSKVLADLLRCSALPRRVHLPSEWVLRLRSQLRLRKWVVRRRAEATVRAKALMRHVGIKTAERTFRTEGSWKRVLKEQSSWADLIRPIYEIWVMFGDHLDKIEEELNKMLPESDERMVLLLSIPGIGFVTARTFIAGVEDVERFSRADQLVSYAGFAPSMDSSGDRQHTGSITKRGRSELRDVYVEAAWSALNSKRPETAHLRRFFYHIMKRRCSQVAIVALAKKLLVISYYIMKHRTMFGVDRCTARAA